LKDLIASAKASPGKYSYASTGPGSPIFAGTEALKLGAGIDVFQVPFKDMGPMLTDVSSGDVTMIVTSAATVRPVIGKLKPLAIASKQRHPDFPDVPTSVEAGGPAVEVTGWGALVALRGTPKPILDKVRADAVVAMQSPEFQERAAKLGLTPSRGKTSEEMSQFIRSEIERYAEVIKATGARGD
jgi:tripartite-type tricarboxylate transporter receptor subunit TctC